MRGSVSILLTLLLAGTFAGSAATASTAAGVPRVVASIVPVHALVSVVMAGLGEPVLLVPATASPHDYALRPSEARTLQEADLVIWVGPTLENVLRKPIAALGSEKMIVTLIDAPGLSFPDSRRPQARRDEGRHGLSRGDDNRDNHSQPDPHDHDFMRDAHIWLNPDNAETMIDAVAVALGVRDRANAARYTKNAQAVKTKLRTLTDWLGKELRPAREATYVAFHDAYGHFTGRFGLKPVVAIVSGTGRMPGARRIRVVKETIVATGARCVFSEPQFPSQLVRTLTEGTGARVEILDPLGVNVAPGRSAYFALLRSLGESFRKCLGVKP